MDAQLIQSKKEEIVRNFGKWTFDNIHLGADVYTIEKKAASGDYRLRRIIQIIHDISKKPMSQLRILDLGCREGLFAVELARRGAKVVAVEGRKNNIEKVRFVKELLGLENLELVLDDVRNITKDKYGSFDVILCLGILYHLDTPDVFGFLENISDMCDAFTIIDTHISLGGKKAFYYKDRQYWGEVFFEHSPKSSREQRIKNLWASLDNPNSFWFTRPSLYDLLMRIGFSSIYEAHCPAEINKAVDKVTLLAMKGDGVQLVCCPVANSLPVDNYPWRQGNWISAVFGRKLVNMLRKMIPFKLKQIIWRFRKDTGGIDEI